MITIKDKEKIQKFFEIPLEELTPESFKDKLKSLRVKYHPDNFEKFEDETIQEMATEKFQTLEDLAHKINDYFKNGQQTIGNGEAFMNVDAIFSIRKLKIEIRTSDKDLKYKIFGTSYRFLLYGDSYKIPEVNASIIVDESHQGMRIGYKETIRMYLSFGEDVAVEDIVKWFYERIKDGADTLIIGGDVIEVDENHIIYAIKKQSFLRLA